MAAPERVPADVGSVAGARPYGIGGNVPADARAVTYSVHGSASAVPYVSDAPFVPPSYAERETCIGTRTNGLPCKAKAEPQHQFCGSHLSQE